LTFFEFRINEFNEFWSAFHELSASFSHSSFSQVSLQFLKEVFNVSLELIWWEGGFSQVVVVNDVKDFFFSRSISSRFFFCSSESVTASIYKRNKLNQSIFFMLILWLERNKTIILKLPWYYFVIENFIFKIYWKFPKVLTRFCFVYLF